MHLAGWRLLLIQLVEYNKMHSLVLMCASSIAMSQREGMKLPSFFLVGGIASSSGRMGQAGPFMSVSAKALRLIEKRVESYGSRTSYRGSA